MTASVPGRIRTDRLLLRSWAAEDAPALLPLLEANRAHLGPWIPPHVAAPVPLDALASRLAGFAGDFAAGRAFRFALLTGKGGQLLGEADLFPRNATGRVPLADADCVELGTGWTPRSPAVATRPRPHARCSTSPRPSSASAMPRSAAR